MGYMAKSAYNILIMLQLPVSHITQFQRSVFSNIWKSASPSKVIAFSWQLLFDRIPTKQNLALRGVRTGNDTLFPLCNLSTETSVHLFLHCGISQKSGMILLDGLIMCWCCHQVWVTPFPFSRLWSGEKTKERAEHDLAFVYLGYLEGEES
jgi:hypothetical protein